MHPNRGCVGLFGGNMMGIAYQTIYEQIFIDFPISRSSWLANQSRLRHTCAMAITKSRFNASWAGTHLSRPCWSIDGSDRMCSGLVGSRTRCPLTSILEPQEAVPQALTLLGEGEFITWHQRHPFLKECRRGPMHFGAVERVWGTVLSLDPPKKGLMPYSSGWWNVRRIAT